MVITIPSFLLSEEHTRALHLKEKPFVLIIPSSFIRKYEVLTEELIFDLVIQNNKLMLVGPNIIKEQRVPALQSSEVNTI